VAGESSQASVNFRSGSGRRAKSRFHVRGRSAIDGPFAIASTECHPLARMILTSFATVRFVVRSSRELRAVSVSNGRTVKREASCVKPAAQPLSLTLRGVRSEPGSVKDIKLVQVLPLQPPIGGRQVPADRYAGMSNSAGFPSAWSFRSQVQYFRFQVFGQPETRNLKLETSDRRLRRFTKYASRTTTDTSSAQQ
jgi:hypothetical protein